MTGTRFATQGLVVVSMLLALSIFAGRPCRAADEDRQADVLVLALPAGAYLLTLQQDDREGAWSLTKSLGLAALSTLALNSVIDKKSPNGRSNDAFPSGHATIAFSAAAFIQQRYGWKPAIPAYAVASYVGWLRIDTDDHDFADVAGGAAIGIISSYLLTEPMGDNVQASAWADGNSAGLQIQYRW